jgi:threonine dehydrogenase-like Zn-dependent dehydrogenase
MVRGVRQRFAASALNYHALRVLGPRLPRLAGGWMPWVGLDRYAPPALPAPDWVRLRPILSGLCGSDMALLTGKASSALSPFASFPAVLGHEVVATVIEAGPQVGDVRPGDRVVVDPLLGCVARGLDLCVRCGIGQTGLCLRTAEGRFAPAPMIGYSRDLPGGWSEEIVAHRSQLHPVPAELSDETAVMVEPFSVALHAVLGDPLQRGEGEPVLVIGGGALGLCTVAALRLTAPESEITLIARHPSQRRMGERLGARVEADPVEAAVRWAGARRHRPVVGEDVLTDGFEVVYDCVGSRKSLDAALRVARSRARIAIVGGPAVIRDLDWTFVWTRELRIEGSYVYGTELSLLDQAPLSMHTMDAAMRLLVEHPDVPLGELVTHRFRLEEWRSAMRTALGRGRSGAIKVVFAS